MKKRIAMILSVVLVCFIAASCVPHYSRSGMVVVFEANRLDNPTTEQINDAADAFRAMLNEMYLPWFSVDVRNENQIRIEVRNIENLDEMTSIITEYSKHVGVLLGIISTSQWLPVTTNNN